MKPSAVAKQNGIVDETPRAVRPLRDNRRMNSLFDGPPERSEELSIEGHLVGGDTEKIVRLMNIEPNINQDRAPVTSQWNMTRSTDCDLNSTI